MSRVIVVTGLPASGKTTVGRRVAAALGLVLLDKDDDLEAAFEEAGPGQLDRAALSRASDVVFRARAEAAVASQDCPGVVLVSFWRRPEVSTTSGTPTDWLATLVRPGDDLVELHCACPPEVALARFRARRRHPGHGDAARTADDLLPGFRAQHALGPLGLGAGRLVVIDTTAVGDEATLSAELR